MKRSYLDYAMSVIVSRAIPDVRDGLKPVHRRILFAMKEGGYDSGKPYKKSARIVGDVMGKYHPHGDSAIYDALVRMAQDFSMRVPLIDGQGNFGSMDGDPAAAMRYTEARLDKAAETMLEDIDRETVEFQANYDESSFEPVVLPAMFPNLLVNGAGGIAVGMATNIPPHNLGEVIDACVAYIDNPAIELDALMEHLPGPDFPTGAMVLGRGGIREAFRTGRGSIVIRARTKIETVRKEREAIVVSEIPYQVNKQKLVEHIGRLVSEKTIDGIAELRDESDRDGVRIVIEVKRDADADVVLNQLFKFTALQSSFGVIMLALNGGRPEVMPLKGVIAAFVEFRERVIVRRTIFELKKARDRAHILAGLAIAVVNVDEIVRLIRAAPDPATAKERLMATPWPAKDVAPYIELIGEPGRKIVDGTYRLSEEQAKAILELRLQRLTGLERDKIVTELQEVVEQIKDLLGILASRDRVLTIIREEFARMKEQFGTPRKTTLEAGDATIEDEESLIQREDMVLTITHQGYVKRVPLSTYRAQRRGGRGRTGMTRKDEDVVSQVYACNTHTPVLFFSSLGMVYKLKVYKLPLGTPQSRGRAFVNLLNLSEGETISVVLPLPDEDKWRSLQLMLATQSGYVRRNSLADFVNVKPSGKIAMKLDQGDRLVGAQVCDENNDVLLATRGGKCIRFHIGAENSGVRVFTGRTSMGVRGINLGEGDDVISMSMLNHTEYSSEERQAYLRRARAERAADETVPETDAEEAASADTAEAGGEGNGDEPEAAAILLSDERYAEMKANEQFILSVAEDGFGKLTSAYEYRITGRGGKGIENIKLDRTKGGTSRCIAAFSAAKEDQLLLVTEQGQIIRTKVDGIRLAGRSTRGVVIFRIDDGDKVVSVGRLGEEDNG
ncbi:MAG: DNA gyrase subunit A [Rhodospirillaceae bacterium]|nr:DNA gyrase subunit A [Rhodospirillaceae bacterium]